MLLYLAGASSLQAMGGLVGHVCNAFGCQRRLSCGVLLGLGVGFVFFFSGKLCKAELDSAERLLVAGLKCLPELQGLVGLVPSVILTAF